MLAFSVVVGAQYQLRCLLIKLLERPVHAFSHLRQEWLYVCGQIFSWRIVVSVDEHILYRVPLTMRDHHVG